MLLSLPTVSVTSGPEWAAQLNAAFELIDAHDHSTDKGTKITPSGLNINADLEFNSNDAIELRSTRFDNQGSALIAVNDIRCVYVVGGDLYYNNSSGTAIQLTAGAGLNAASLGGIGGDFATSSAAVTYIDSNDTFFFTQASNTPANLNAGSVIIREPVASSAGITIKSPIALGGAYNFILPTGLPSSGQTKILTIDSSGQVGAQYDVDAVTLEVSSNALRVKDLGISTGKLAANAVTRPKMESVGQQISSSCGTFTHSTTTPTDVTNLTVTITTSGRPVHLQLIPEGISVDSLLEATGAGSLYILKDGTIIGRNPLDNGVQIPVSSVSFFDTPAAGTYVYKIQIVAQASTISRVKNAKLVAYEL